VTPKDFFTPNRLVALFLCGIAMIFSVLIAKWMVGSFPSFETTACGTRVTGDCVGWSLIFIGPFYLLFFVLWLAFAFMVAALPLALFAGFWFMPSSRAARRDDERPRMGFWAFFKMLKDGGDNPDA
jgi:hypothetical protein